MYTMETPLQFGKFKGQTIEHVLAVKPSYIRWALNTVKMFEVDEQVQKALDSRKQIIPLHDYDDDDHYYGRDNYFESDWESWW
jgi:ribosomal protein L11 methylase PrmA